MSTPDLAPGRPRLLWEGAEPRTAAFDDIYYAPTDERGSGLGESDAVFLQGCRLPDAWAGRKRFIVGELGFGTGLNLLALWRAWRRARPPGAHLHFVSVEGFPLARDDAERALSAFPEVADLARALLAAWPQRIKGVHRRCLPDGVFLTLAYLEATDALGALDFAADAWFLDGFAPAKNPDMWRAEVLSLVAARSNPGARLATFTVAGAVRRGLEAVGFAVEKRPGFGRKRERLAAIYQGPRQEPGGGAAASLGGRRVEQSRGRGPQGAPSLLFPRATAPEGPVMILGAGIAGACAAAALRRRSVNVIVLDSGDGPAQGASGMPSGLIAPRLDLDDRPAARFHRAAYAHALTTYQGSSAFRQTGVVRAGKDAVETERLLRLLDAEALPPDMALAASVAAAYAADAGAGRSQAGADAPALLFPEGGLLDPRAFIVTALADVPTLWRARVSRLTHQGKVWVARDADGRALAEAAACVVALGPGVLRLAQTAALPVRPIRGQVTLAHLAGPPPARPLVWGPYVAPLTDGRLLIGATYDPVSLGGESCDPVDYRTDGAADSPNAGLEPFTEDDARNLAALADFAPDLAALAERSGLQSRVGVRATTPDRLPYAGAAPDAEAWRTLLGSTAGRRDVLGPLHEGLYVLGGLGSRGLVWAPLLAEAVASELLGEPGALEIGAAAVIHPARALMRAMRRGP
jgi:tRNA 5-methylaminomethyl-2-thiouridine biosynthesis bifunctional protein